MTGAMSLTVVPTHPHPTTSFPVLAKDRVYLMFPVGITRWCGRTHGILTTKKGIMKLITPIAFVLVAIFAITISISLLNHEHSSEIYNDYKHLRGMQQIQSDDIDTLYRLVEKLHQPQANIMMYEQHHDVGLEKLRRWTK